MFCFYSVKKQINRSSVGKKNRKKITGPFNRTVAPTGSKRHLDVNSSRKRHIKLVCRKERIVSLCYNEDITYKGIGINTRYQTISLSMALGMYRLWAKGLTRATNSITREEMR